MVFRFPRPEVRCRTASSLSTFTAHTWSPSRWKPASGATRSSLTGPSRAIPRSRIEEHLKTLAEAGLDPAVVDFGPLSTLNVLKLFEGERPDRYAFLHVGPTQGTLALYQDGALAHLRVIDVHGGAAGLAREVD